MDTERKLTANKDLKMYVVENLSIHPTGEKKKIK